MGKTNGEMIMDLFPKARSVGTVVIDNNKGDEPRVLLRVNYQWWHSEYKKDDEDEE